MGRKTRQWNTTDQHLDFFLLLCEKNSLLLHINCRKAQRANNSLAILTCISKQFMCIWPYGDATCTLWMHLPLCACCVQREVPASDTYPCPGDQSQHAPQTRPERATDMATGSLDQHFTRSPSCISQQGNHPNDHPSTRKTGRGKRSLKQQIKKNETSRAPNAPRTRITRTHIQTKPTARSTPHVRAGGARVP